MFYLLSTDVFLLTVLLLVSQTPSRYNASSDAPVCIKHLGVKAI